MYSLYVVEDNKLFPKLLIRYDENEFKNEYEVINKYFNSTGMSYNGYRFLGDLSGIVYRMSFMMNVEGEEMEYVLVHK